MYLFIYSFKFLYDNSASGNNLIKNILNYKDLNEFTQLTDVNFSENIEKEYELSTKEEIKKFERQCNSSIFPRNLSFGDGNINWRYGILVDTLNCVVSSTKSLIIGYQYAEVMTPMIIEERDGLHTGLVSRGYPNLVRITFC